MFATDRHIRKASTKRRTQEGRWSRDGFFQALRAMGATGHVTYCHSPMGTSDTEEVHSGFLSCPREAWVQAFGDPETVVHHEDQEVAWHA